MNNLPYEVELIIYRYFHELNMIELKKELKSQHKQIDFTMTYLQNRSFYPYYIYNRLKIYGVYAKNKISKYVHRKKLSRCLLSIIKPVHIFYTGSL